MIYWAINAAKSIFKNNLYVSSESKNFRYF